MLRFLMYSVLAHPEIYEKLRAEVDAVLGGEKIRPEHLGRMSYPVAIMREVPRHNSPIPPFSVQPFEHEVIRGKYFKKGQGVLHPIATIHRNPEVWGDDVAEFKPERMLDGKSHDKQPKVWIPFGNGARACIGRSFAWQEAIMAVATIVQKFDFRMAGPSYTLDIKQTLTIKPDNFSFYASPRKGASFSVSLGPSAPATATCRGASDRIPKLIDAALERNGAERLLERGLADAGGDRFFEAFDEWETKLWETLAAVYDTAPAQQVHSGLDVKLAPPTQRASRLRQPDAQLDVVRQNTLLTRSGAIAKHHLASERESLGRLLNTCVHDVLEKHVGVLSLLETHPGIDIPLSTFPGMPPAMRVRQYSISSSPLCNPNADTLMLGILRDAWPADSKELFHGVAVRPSSAAFHLPETPETPVVMFASGSGIAPMRGFLQERAMLKTAGRTIGPALFFGCRSPDLDFLFADTDLKASVAHGVVDVRPAFSRAPELSRGCKSVQDRVWHDAEDVLAAFDSGAEFFTCGSTCVALGIEDLCMHPFEKKKDRVLDGEKGP
ncbi:cytochrome P450 [Auricularia subglabra TFB-10046 SS5]|nr:cytochrome P450 [Auricularia subglabra TFB-10046 SS5]